MPPSYAPGCGFWRLCGAAAFPLQRPRSSASQAPSRRRRRSWVVSASPQPFGGQSYLRRRFFGAVWAPQAEQRSKRAWPRVSFASLALAHVHLARRSCHGRFRSAFRILSLAFAAMGAAAMSTPNSAATSSSARMRSRAPPFRVIGRSAPAAAMRSVRSTPRRVNRRSGSSSSRAPRHRGSPPHVCTFPPNPDRSRTF